jgi:hypothetical protein
MRRAASYSDSFIVLRRNESLGDMNGLTPILIPTSDTDSPRPIPALTPRLTQPLIQPAATATDATGNIQDATSFHEEPQPLEIEHTIQPLRRVYRPSRSCMVLTFLLTFKGSFHLLLISAFETLFYFEYVNKSENAGIVKTINTYYNPLVQDCQTTWSNTTRWLVQELLTYEINQHEADIAGIQAASARTAFNDRLVTLAAMYSVICLGLCATITGIVKWKGWIVPWRRIITENLMFVLILGLYEVFFFRTIIYQYQTISTAELNQYIVDGLATCALQPPRNVSP